MFLFSRFWNSIKSHKKKQTKLLPIIYTIFTQKKKNGWDAKKLIVQIGNNVNFAN